MKFFDSVSILVALSYKSRAAFFCFLYSGKILCPLAILNVKKRYSK